MKRVGAPGPSPDGKWVVFSVVEPAYDEKDQVSDLWIVPADSSAKPRRITNTKGGESSVTWSPDSSRIVFAARREGDEANQLYVMDVLNGGEAMRVTTLSTGARSPQFSPDGKWLLLQSGVYPGTLDDAANQKIAAERKARKYNARVYESFPIRNWDRWIDEKQSHVFVQSLEPGAKAKDLLAGTRLASEPGFSGAFTSGSDDLQAVWTPDGANVVFVAMTNRHTAAYAETNTSLYQVSVSGGEPKALTTGNDSYANPRFSPTGQLYCLFNPANDKTYNLDRLVWLNWPTANQRKVLTTDFDRSVTSFVPAADGRVYFLAEDAGNENLYSVTRDSGKVETLIDLEQGCYSNLALPGNLNSSPVLLANWDSVTNPIEIVRISPGAKQHKALTDFNSDRISRLDWQAARQFTFTSKPGRSIHNMLVLPPNFDENKKYPLFVVIHGGPHSMWRDQFVLRWNYHLLAAPGYVVLLTNYTGSTGFGEKFAQAIMGDPLKTPGDEINEAADEAIKRFKFIDATRLAAGGASYGGHLANWLQATTTRYKCLLSHAGWSTWNRNGPRATRSTAANAPTAALFGSRAKSGANRIQSVSPRNSKRRSC
jgi:dipeptidyl aminopeptidase/acylaminoacyl peptidase